MGVGGKRNPSVRGAGIRARCREGEFAGLPEQEDVLKAAEDAVEERQDQGVQRR